MVIDGRFRLGWLLGEGTFGEVWAAADGVRGGAVALKLIRPDLANREEIIRRFEREIEILARIHHPNVVRPIAARTGAPPLYLAMDLLAGTSLRGELERRAVTKVPFSNEELVMFVRESAAALTAAHALGVVHRDLKPSNLMVELDAEQRLAKVRILDFGIARMVATSGDQTTIGRVLGTMLYMAPEQLRGEPADERADLFALAAMAFELATMRRPFAHNEQGDLLPISGGPVSLSGRNAYAELVHRMIVDPRPLLSTYRPELGLALSEVVARGLASDRDRRFSTCQEFADAFVNALGTGPGPNDLGRVARARAETEAPSDAKIATLRNELEEAYERTPDAGHLHAAALAPTDPPDLDALTAVMPSAMTRVADPSAGDDITASSDAHERPTVQTPPKDHPVLKALALLALMASVSAVTAAIVGRGSREVRVDAIVEERRVADAPPVAPAAVRAEPRVKPIAIEVAEVPEPEPPPAVRSPAPRPPPSERATPPDRAPEVVAPVDPWAFDASDPASVLATATRLERAAAALADPEARVSIQRCAALAGARADGAELAACVARYRAARKNG